MIFLTELYVKGTEQSKARFVFLCTARHVFQHVPFAFHSFPFVLILHPQGCTKRSKQKGPTHFQIAASRRHSRHQSNFFLTPPVWHIQWLLPVSLQYYHSNCKLSIVSPISSLQIFLKLSAFFFFWNSTVTHPASTNEVFSFLVGLAYSLYENQIIQIRNQIVSWTEQFPPPCSNKHPRPISEQWKWKKVEFSPIIEIWSFRRETGLVGTRRN